MQPPLNPNRFYCPHCGTENPPYIFHAGGGNLGVMGNVIYLTIVCGGEITCTQCLGKDLQQAKVSECTQCNGTGKEHCRRILGVNIVDFKPGLGLELHPRGGLHV